MVPFGSGWA
jgi:hypothetical protein